MAGMRVVIDDALQAAIDRRVTADEVRAARDGVITDAERDEVLALIRWFTTRYPTPADRLRYVRDAYARWRTATHLR